MKSVPVCLPRKELVGLPSQMLARVEDDYNEIEGRFEKFQYIMGRTLQSFRFFEV